LTLKIAIIGMGIAGRYLAARIADRHEVVGFEAQQSDDFYPICAWGTSINEMRGLSKRVGLNFDDYVFHVGREILVDLDREILSIKAKGLCTFDKLRFEKDLSKNTEIKFGSKILSPPNGYDIIVDATGVARSLLPKPMRQYFIPTMQYRVKCKDPPFDDFYIKPFDGLSGYLWYFPLGEHEFHIGAGDYHGRHVNFLNSFIRKCRGEILRMDAKPVRIAPPHFCRPIRQGKIVGIGEAIGTVYPMLGEGIIPSIWSAEILANKLEDLNEYERSILKMFKPFMMIFAFIEKLLKGSFLVKRDWHLIFKIYLHMKFKEERYGVECHLKDFLKVLKNKFYSASSQLSSTSRGDCMLPKTMGS